MPWCGNFHTETLEVCFGTPQTSKKSLQKRFHAEACRRTVLEQKKGGKGGGKGERGRSESRPEKCKQQCIYFSSGACQRGDQCRYEHQVCDDGQPIPVAPEIIQRFEDAVKRYSETRAQAKPKPAPRGGVSSSMIILESDDLEHGVVLSAAQARDSDEYYAMLDSGTNAIILPLHPRMQGDFAE